MIREQPVFFPAGPHELFGVVTLPLRPSHTGIVVLSGGGTPLSTGVNGVSVRVCRMGAERGFVALRFDYHGVGESDGEPDRFDLGSPYVADLEGALEQLAHLGVGEFIIVGECFGARTALSVAASTRHHVAAVLAISPSIRDFEMGERVTTRLATEYSIADHIRRALTLRTLRRALGSQRRSYARIAKEKLRSITVSRSGEFLTRYVVSAAFLGTLEAASRKGIQTTLLYGEDDDFLSDLRRAAEYLPPSFGSGSDVINVRTVPGKIHGLASVVSQDATLSVVDAWLQRLVDERSAEGPAGIPVKI